MTRRTKKMDEVPLPESSKGGTAAAAAAGPASLESWRTQPDAATLTPRDQALREVLADFKALGIEIVTGEEAERYLDHAARVNGIPPEAMHASTLGDVVLMREAAATDVRTLREELIHTQQQKEGMEVSPEAVTRGEVEARELLLQNANRWGITEEERAEIREDLRKIEERGGY
jgi:hypothetical protein